MYRWTFKWLLHMQSCRKKCCCRWQW